MSVSKGLTIFFTKSWVYPETESGILITASGTTLASQWKLWESVVRSINMNQIPLDPVDQTKYTYSTNGTKTKYQLMTYTENSSLVSVVPHSYAQDLSDRGIQIQGDWIWVILNTDNSLLNQNIDTFSWTGTYKVVFDTSTSLEWSGNLLFSQIYNMRDDLLKNKEIAKLDNSLVGYWDMESLYSLLWIVQIKDLSKYDSHLWCFNNGVLESCANNPDAPHFAKWLHWNWIQIFWTGNNLNSNLDYLWQDNSKWNYSNFDNISLIFNVKIDWPKPFLWSSVFNDYFIFSRDTRPTDLGWCNILFIGAPSRTTYLYDTIYAGYSTSKCKNQTISDNVTINGNLRNLSQWYQYWVVIFNNKITYYVDGKEIGSTLYTGSFWNYNYPLILWNSPHGFQNLNGTIDEVRVYNRAISNKEMKAIYISTK